VSSWNDTPVGVETLLRDSIHTSATRAPSLAARTSFDGSTVVVTRTRDPGTLEGHQHAPAMHDRGVVHRVPHAPQFEPSVMRSTHAAPHCVCPVGQRHVELAQVAVGGQTRPQLPQFAGSLESETQVAEAAQ
jgi:hypothetical protein